MNLKSLPLLAVALALAACEDGGLQSPVEACITINGGGTQVIAGPQALCSGCTVTSETDSIDGDKGSSASLAFDTDGTGTITLRVEAQDGVVFPAGSQAGVVVSIPESSSQPYIGFYVDTFLDGVRQDRIHNTGGFIGQTSTGGFGQGCSGPCDSGQRNLDGSAPRDFDGIEIGFARDDSGTPQTIRVYEFCSDENY